MKKTITKYVKNVGLWELDDKTLEELLLIVNGWIKQYGNCKIDTGENEFDLSSTREETDEEYNKRIESENNWAKVKDQQERKDYERLKAKFEK